MFCLALRRDSLERIGPLDERYEVGMLEDDDYARRAHAAGYRVVCAEDAFVHHFGQASFGALVPTGDYARLLNANQRRFEEKWGAPWRPYARRSGEAYRRLIGDVRAAVRAAVPAGARVAVISRGDEALLQFDHCAGWHFPQSADGGYAGHYPKDGEAALAHLESLRTRGAQFLVVPAPSSWWLAHYVPLGRALESKRVWRTESCAIFELTATDVREAAAAGLPGGAAGA
jgi:hypothetical protein